MGNSANQMPEDIKFSIAEAASYLKISVRTLYRRISNGIIIKDIDNTISKNHLDLLILNEQLEKQRKIEERNQEAITKLVQAATLRIAERNSRINQYPG